MLLDEETFFENKDVIVGEVLDKLRKSIPVALSYFDLVVWILTGKCFSSSVAQANWPS